MVTVNKKKYLERRVTKNGMRDWWFPIFNLNKQLIISINQVILPKEFEGKKVRFHVEVLDEDNDKD